jgi:hypothetical protein
MKRKEMLSLVSEYCDSSGFLEVIAMLDHIKVGKRHACEQ